MDKRFWESLSSLFYRREINAKTILLHEGKVTQNMFYIEKGCLRIWFYKDGKEITFQFFFEGQFISSFESFRTNQPSLYTIETIEPCILQEIPKKAFTAILEKRPDIKELFQEYVFERLIFYQKLFVSRITEKPEKRYMDLIDNNPEILKRIPQHYIASYLGITPVSLSRIRNRLIS